MGYVEQVCAMISSQHLKINSDVLRLIYACKFLFYTIQINDSSIRIHYQRLLIFKYVSFIISYGGRFKIETIDFDTKIDKFFI